MIIIDEVFSQMIISNVFQFYSAQCKSSYLSLFFEFYFTYHVLLLSI